MLIVDDITKMDKIISESDKQYPFRKEKNWSGCDTCNSLIMLKNDDANGSRQSCDQEHSLTYFALFYTCFNHTLLYKNNNQPEYSKNRQPFPQCYIPTHKQNCPSTITHLAWIAWKETNPLRTHMPTKATCSSVHMRTIYHLLLCYHPS